MVIYSAIYKDISVVVGSVGKKGFRETLFTFMAWDANKEG